MNAIRVNSIDEIQELVSNYSERPFIFKCAAIGDGLLIYETDIEDFGKIIIELYCDEKDFFGVESLDNILIFNNITYFAVNFLDKNEKLISQYVKNT